MNEFIVWDNLEEEWVDEEYIARYSGGVLFIADLDNEVVDLLHNENDKENRYIPFDYIGKTDINNEKIYADSSIVEFELSDRVSETIRIQRGYFTYSPDNLSYMWVSDTWEGKKVEWGNHKLKYIRIIDTIQENKLGLIK